ncbi:hypothetical protein DAPPUDRAFT_233628 [Daphnia pulex]|uniref:Uncharacterized protein n=1 Tax=Daphnia pulex TaxID=6669 RepID=E9FVB0_DAPPU|nr:hypothetical protein DAPPUDRAFT_233628 [Daphnia pulex]|eukprot:EFX88529.1 hypothetical protein DAPPUDRAFT_233628 [Daphnia pulex]
MSELTTLTTLIRLKSREELRLSEVFNFVTRFSIVGRTKTIVHMTSAKAFDMMKPCYYVHPTMTG